jgi:hypothetical protein
MTTFFARARNTDRAFRTLFHRNADSGQPDKWPRAKFLCDIPYFHVASISSQRRTCRHAKPPHDVFSEAFLMGDLSCCHGGLRWSIGSIVISVCR